jgi:hypothetical protein
MENEAEHGLVEDPEPGVWEEDKRLEDERLEDERLEDEPPTTDH